MYAVDDDGFYVRWIGYKAVETRGGGGVLEHPIIQIAITLHGGTQELGLQRVLVFLVVPFLFSFHRCGRVGNWEGRG